jgi:predicted membrane GTPase involved in stress response
VAILNMNDEQNNIFPLFETIINHVIIEKTDLTKDFKMQITNLSYDNYL